MSAARLRWRKLSFVMVGLHLAAVPLHSLSMCLCMQTTSQDALTAAAAQDSLSLAYASAWLGSPGCRPSAALLRELLASAASHKAVSVQAAAAQLAPAVLAAAANASAAGLSQVIVEHCGTCTRTLCQLRCLDDVQALLWWCRSRRKPETRVGRKHTSC